MCGITASIALPQAHTNGNINGCTDHYTNGHTNGAIVDSASQSLTSKLQASIEKINHRGPDESGVWVSPDGSVGLGHCRLSINDLSPSGSQPLTSDDGQIHAIVNGEIYDHDRLRGLCAVVHGYQFSGESDSELVLALYKIYGSPEFFKHLRGEFAFVLYDSREGSKKVIAGRDRFGIKPLVWTVVGNRILLAAEAKAFLPLGWKPKWDVASIIQGGWMIDDRTSFKGVKKVLPGHWLEISERGLETHKYWDGDYSDKTKPETRTINEMVIGVRERLVESIRLRLRADVPVGVYLSGGIDSSAVAGIVTQLAKKQHVKIGNQSATTRVACFSVQFPSNTGYDESDIADRTAKWLGVETIKKDVDEATLAEHFADTAYHCEHHHYDLNSVAKFALSTLPQENGVKVVLTGEGSDEHFAGYPYYPQDFLLEPDLSQPDSPLASNDELREHLQKSVVAEMNKIFSGIGISQHGEQKDNPCFADFNGSSMPETLMFCHPSTEIFAPWVRQSNQGVNCRKTVIESHSLEVRAKMRSKWHPLHTSLYLWNKTSLANVLLSCLGDRTEMAHSVEARTPFLDHHLVEYVNNLPPSVKIAYTPQQTAEGQDQGAIWKNAGSALQSFTEKWILREAVRPYITDELYQRRKHPFLAPARWPKNGPLHRMFEELLTREAVEGLGFVDWDVVESALGRAFGDDADSRAFRTLVYTGSWVTLAQRFGIEKAVLEDYIA
ncbi:asparagine synthase (glutamine-hydrolyzing) [Helicocarpus griseus UAMH5409]|uniref:Asparagine synthase (Glutamine-hydrolyzing) n=1 Tax=Helicocarpus griseus UAMH5409 TaxID=1447875 RepID=A0A2B7Y9D9_9EURO|nr:asparagine synthase (glutamine-hydrolyzing) [Helicocarpus griseus UAMH5409]